MFLDFILHKKDESTIQYKPVTKSYHFSYKVTENDYTFMLQ